MRVIRLILALMPLATAHAQTIFFDDFNGPDFHPRWQHGNGPNGGNWTYDFQDGMFNLRTVRGNPVVPERRVPIGTLVDLPGDFTVTTRIGWGLGPPRREIGLRLLSNGAFAGSLFMSEFGNGLPRLWWEFAGVSGSIPLPTQGFTTVSLERRGSFMFAFADGSALASARLSNQLRIDGVQIDMLGDSRGMQPLHIDFVQVVPTLGTACTLVIVGFPLIMKRRR